MLLRGMLTEKRSIRNLVSDLISEWHSILSASGTCSHASIYSGSVIAWKTRRQSAAISMEKATSDNPFSLTGSNFGVEPFVFSSTTIKLVFRFRARRLANITKKGEERIKHDILPLLRSPRFRRPACADALRPCRTCCFWSSGPMFVPSARPGALTVDSDLSHQPDSVERLSRDRTLHASFALDGIESTRWTYH
jgi:hypothetical protein